MSQYYGAHSVTFTNDTGESRNTWMDWQLIPVSRPTISPPKAQNFTEEIDGVSGKLDFQDSITTSPIFFNREGTMEFILDHDSDVYKVWTELYSEISNFLHGRQGTLTLEDEPEYYYEGRFTVEDFKSNADWSTVSIHYDLKPYKKSILTSLNGDFSGFSTRIQQKSENFSFVVSSGSNIDVNISDILNDHILVDGFETEIPKLINPVHLTVIIGRTNQYGFIVREQYNDLHIVDSDSFNEFLKTISFPLYKEFPSFNFFYSVYQHSVLPVAEFKIRFRKETL